MVRVINDFFPTLIVILVVVLLAFAIIYNSNRNQREVLDTVRQAIRHREEQDARDRMEALIKSNMKEPEKWETANELMNLTSPD